jgi:hypothetical protein
MNMAFISFLSIVMMACFVGYYIVWLGAAFPQSGFVLRRDR